MALHAHPFDLKLLTASKDVGLRRLRSYAASLGGGAQIFHSVDDLVRSLESAGRPPSQSIVLHDTTLVVTAAETQALMKLARVFQLNQPRAGSDLAIPAKTSPCWQLESYMRCTMTAFFESPMVRMSMANLCKAGGSFHLEHLLRWGYAAQHWQRSSDATIADASYAFVRSLSLSGEGRRLTEVASHFLQTSLTPLGLAEQSVTFGSDGLSTIVIARCAPRSGLELSEVARELRVMDFPVGIVNQLPTGVVEVGALFHPANAIERMLMVFRKSNDPSRTDRTETDGAPRPTLVKAG